MDTIGDTKVDKQAMFYLNIFQDTVDARSTIILPKNIEINERNDEMTTINFNDKDKWYSLINGGIEDKTMSFLFSTSKILAIRDK